MTTTGIIYDRKVNDKAVISKLQYLTIATCFLMNMCDGMDVMVISYTANAITKEWNINPASFGIVFSVGLFGMALGAMMLASKADVYGRKPMIILCAVLMGVSVFLTGFAQTLPQLILLRFLSGIGIGSMLACTSTLTAEYAPVPSKNFWVSFVMSGYPVVAVFSGLAATKIIEMEGWRMMFFFAGIATLLTVPAAVFLMKESLEFLFKSQPVNALERANKILVAMQSKPLAKLPIMEEKKFNSTVVSLFSSMVRRSTFLLWTAFLCCFAALYFLTSWIPKLAAIAGMSASEAIYAGILFNLGAFAGIITQGYLSAHFGLRKVICFFLLGTALLMVLYGFISGSMMILLLFSLIGFCIQGGFIGLYAVAARIYPTEIRGTGIGWAIGFGRLGAILGPLLGGLLISSGASVHMNFIAFAIPVIIAGLITLLITSPDVS
jgi:AAHS family 4-hydroxybenzoate transporter-like MFS transporter